MVGLDPTRDVHWVSSPQLQPLELFVEGKIDAFLTISPELQEVRARKIGHVLVSSIVDRPWSEYYCCLLATSTEALQTLNEVPYGDWRDSDPEDTLRFYALRLREAGFIKSSPQTIMSRGTDWRFLNELKRELKT